MIVLNYLSQHNLTTNTKYNWVFDLPEVDQQAIVQLLEGKKLNGRSLCGVSWTGNIYSDSYQEKTIEYDGKIFSCWTKPSRQYDGKDVRMRYLHKD